MKLVESLINGFQAIALESGGVESIRAELLGVRSKMSGVKKDMKNKKVTTKVEWLGIAATIVFLAMALKMNSGWALLLVGSFALICLGLASPSMWFRAFGVRNTRRKIKKTAAKN